MFNQTDLFRHRMFRKHPMSFCRASTVCSRRISPDEGFPRHRMSVRHPMSNRDEYRWEEQTPKWCFRGSIDVGATGGRPYKYFQTSDVFPVGFIFQVKTYWRKIRLYDL